MLSSTGFMLLQIVDGLYLGHYSSEAVAAIGPAGMAMYLTGAFFSGVIGYTSTLVAHCYGAKKEKGHACRCVARHILGDDILVGYHYVVSFPDKNVPCF